MPLNQLTIQEFEAVKMLRDATRGSFDIFALSGAQGEIRAAILSKLSGGKRISQRQAGVTSLRTAFYDAFGIFAGCLAERDETFRNVCKQLLAAEVAAESARVQRTPNTNRNRAARADAAILAYSQANNGDDPAATLTDLLTDIMHYCDRTRGLGSLAFSGLLETARRHYDAERGNSALRATAARHGGTQCKP